MFFYEPVHFKISEFLPKEIFELKNVSPVWFINPKILFTADKLRERYKKPLYINTWMFKNAGNFNYRGFRPENCIVGAKLSQHKIGNAIDFNVEDFTSLEIQNDIIKNPFIEPFKYITCLEIEQGVEKTHIDCRPHNKEKYGLLILKKRSIV